MPSWITEFGPEFEVPGFVQFLVKQGIVEDVSYHNDGSPSFSVYSLKPELAVVLWVAHPILSRREHPWKRYTVTWMVDGDEKSSTDFDELEKAMTSFFRLIPNVKALSRRGVKEWVPKEAPLEFDDPEEYLSGLIGQYIKKERTIDRWP